jgi:hypothetical protein
MGLADIDFDQVKESGSFDNLPVGDHHVVVISAKEVFPNDGKSDYVMMVFKAVEGEPHEGKTMPRRWYLSPKAVGMYKGACVALGCDPNEPASAIGREAIITVAAQTSGDFAGRTEVKGIKSVASRGTSSSAPSASKMPARTVKF